MKNKYSISKIIPSCVAKVKEVVMEQENMDDKAVHSFVNRKNFWKKVKGIKENRALGSVFGDIEELNIPLSIFGDWRFVRSKRGFAWAWNTKTKKRIYLSDFDLYVAITEFQIHWFNNLQHISKLDNGVENSLFIDYSDFFDKNENYLLTEDGDVYHGTVVGEFIIL